MQEVSVVIPNFNGMAYLDGVLSSLERQTISNFEVILVDNGSTDGSCAFVAAEYPWVHMIQLPENYGFSRAVNEGIHAARSPYVLLLNNDTEAETDFIEEMVAALRRHRKAFSCQAKMIQLHDRDKMDDAGNYYCALGWAYARGKGKDISNYDINHRADAGIGYAFQQPPRFKGMTVMKLLSLSAGKELKREECCKLLSTVGLCANEYIEREVDGTLSGGEMKRLEIATVLAKSHKLCIFDEPEAGIDLWSFSMLIEQFEKIHKEKKESLVLISHQERIIQMADRIMVIEDGKIASIGATDEILPQLLGKTADSYSCLTCR